MGPIRAQLKGKGTYKLIEVEKTGSMAGAGADEFSGSRVRGALNFAMTPEGANATRLTLVSLTRCKASLPSSRAQALQRILYGSSSRSLAKMSAPVCLVDPSPPRQRNSAHGEFCGCSSHRGGTDSAGTAHEQWGESHYFAGTSEYK